jgi:hypothetical protein
MGVALLSPFYFFVIFWCLVASMEAAVGSVRLLIVE